MRYPEDKIKEAILHPDIEIRDQAVSYFAKSFSADTSIMPTIVRGNTHAPAVMIGERCSDFIKEA